MVEQRSAYKILVGNPERKRALGRSKREDNIKIGFREICCDCVEWTHMDRDRDQGRDPVNTVMNLGGDFLD
jgi:hypothetical protein